MKAVSNGFCILNAAACVALYAVTPASDRGLGLGRVCIIDFDVHVSSYAHYSARS
jgi:acetoin utilization deacetylase AcuC-like enzyme